MEATRAERFTSALHAFPDPAKALLQHLPQQTGRLSSKTCNLLMDLMHVSMEELMVCLLPLAKVFSTPAISHFHVGAVALAGDQGVDGEMDLYLGANMEFEHLALNMSIHAEQAVVMNAWQHGAERVKSIATSELPCGHCRQFLNELSGSRDLMVVKPLGEEHDYRSSPLWEILPAAFSPSDLGNKKGFMNPLNTRPRLSLADPVGDSLVQGALSAAESSYAPYTGNFAGCALETAGGQMVSGSYVESVAYNPSISPLHSTLSRLNMMTAGEIPIIHRIVLVETPTRVRQKDLVEMLMRSRARHVELEYYISKKEESS
jgi:cytidine deaminase